jgi:hypothetical protein
LRIADPALAAWDFGPATAALANAYRVTQTPWTPARAWFVPDGGRSTAAILAMSDEPAGVLRVLEAAHAASFQSGVPERALVELQANGPGLAVMSQLDDPEWRGRLTGPSGTSDVAVERVFGNRVAGWQAVRIPDAGRWTIELVYRGRAARFGLAVSAVAWAALAVAYWRLARRAPASGTAP